VEWYHVCWPRLTAIRVEPVVSISWASCFIIRTQRGSVLYVFAEFEADSSIHPKVIKGSQNFEIGSRDSGHAHLGVVLWSTGRRGTSSISVQNLKRIAQFVQMLLRVPKFENYITWPRPYVERLRPLCLYHLWRGSSIHPKVICGSLNFEIEALGSRDDGPSLRTVVLWSTRRRGPSSITAPKTVRSNVINWVPQFGNRSCDHGHAHLGGRFVIRTQGGSVLYVCTKFEGDSSVRSKVIRGFPKFRNWVTWPRPSRLRGHFMVHAQEGSVLHLCTKFEADCLIPSNVMKGSEKFGN